MSTVVLNSLPTAELRRRQEASKARRRFYPSTALYTAYGAFLLVLGVRSARPATAVAYFAGGVVIWTLVEYLVHRFVLHGRFPDGGNLFQRLTHRYFDHLHWEHHARPWDGNHVNGTLKDTLPFAIVFAVVASFFPLATGPMLVAGLMTAYVAEEWIHHSVHFYRFENRYFQYIRRHHLYHHSPKGMEVGFGLTNAFWDIVWDTRIPEAEREALYAGMHRASPGKRHHPSHGKMHPTTQGDGARGEWAAH